MNTIQFQKKLTSTFWCVKRLPRSCNCEADNNGDMVWPSSRASLTKFCTLLNGCNDDLFGVNNEADDNNGRNESGVDAALEMDLAVGVIGDAVGIILLFFTADDSAFLVMKYKYTF